MYDFTNLSDVEFEKLSADILSRKLGVKLRYFSPGRDGGIDLTDDVAQKNIVVQVKHYAKSSFTSLLTSLKKEVDKVDELKPTQYYVCVSQQLTATNINEIYELFKGYMKDTSNIITRDILVEFLEEESNQDILRKNFKLWLLSDKLLKDIFNNNVFIDSEVLLEDIDDEFKYFVQTKVFNEALEILKKSRLIMIQGSPGVGKSINSKMLAAAFVKEDYIIRYTTDGQVSNIKSVISQNPDVKEVILLDDCLGQYYFSLKEGQDLELISLIKYIKQYENKVLILNTRVTIFNEAIRSRLQFRRYLDKGKLPIKTIDIDGISVEEKAEIFYNHLSKNKIPKAYFSELRKDKKYRKIIEHRNYNPRIIEFVTEEYRFSKVSPPDYYNFILNHLNNPMDVWADEFEQKLEEIDRIFMYTLFSLTDTYTDINALEDCFIFRLNNEGRAKSTVNLFDEVKSRLTKSLVRIMDVNGSRKIGVLNPSINDYMNSYLHLNKIGLNAIKESILYIEQLEKIFEKEEAEKILISKLISGEFINLKSFGNKKIEYLFYGISKYNILTDSYKPIIKSCFQNIDKSLSFFGEKLEKKDLLVKFLEEPALYKFYEIEQNLKNEEFKDDFISNLDYKGIIEVLSVIKNKELSLPGLTEQLESDFFDSLDFYLSDDIEIYDYIEDIDGFEVFYDLMPPEEHSKEFDEEVQKLRSSVRNLIAEELRSQLGKKIDFEAIKEELEEILEITISKDKLYDAVERHLYQENEPDFDDYPYDYDNRGYEPGDVDQTDIIFERDYPEVE
ncbi:AAA ATPase [Neobacillus bataviensis LMG 21833]|uniref:AAA ATPase n=1 Tax=Neobacillus bataviensis LMG 21833 TaxID=1117379 RepID=K6CKC1_9BACI|nr:restriction endonuclease [Neobacillus bataviensis]EKN71590.1 AAA ATPase [Neobacillus bataviensis LMG 21833]